ncbi:hypothetical protein E4U55_006336 [Claviceps digitariae]|nr:hypothetical protein E4U55_006336 [Claviceps digitariae]
MKAVLLDADNKTRQDKTAYYWRKRPLVVSFVFDNWPSEQNNERRGSGREGVGGLSTGHVSIVLTSPVKQRRVQGTWLQLQTGEDRGR